MQELSFDHPSHLDQFGTHLAVWDQFFMYSTVNRWRQGKIFYIVEVHNILELYAKHPSKNSVLF